MTRNVSLDDDFLWSLVLEPLWKAAELGLSGPRGGLGTFLGVTSVDLVGVHWNPFGNQGSRAGAQRSQGWFGYFLGSPWLIWLVCVETPLSIMAAELECGVISQW